MRVSQFRGSVHKWAVDSRLQLLPISRAAAPHMIIATTTFFLNVIVQVLLNVLQLFLIVSLRGRLLGPSSIASYHLVAKEELWHWHLIVDPLVSFRMFIPSSTHSPDINVPDFPIITYRVDGRSPDEIYGPGFVAWGNNMDLWNHVCGAEDSGYVAATLDPFYAGLARPAWRLDLHGSGNGQWVDVNQSLGIHEWDYESEIAYPNHINPEDIIGARQVLPNGDEGLLCLIPAGHPNRNWAGMGHPVLAGHSAFKCPAFTPDEATNCSLAGVTIRC